MTSEIPKNNPEIKGALQDNARKFVVEYTDDMESFRQFLDTATMEHLVVDWTETGDSEEEKVVKKFAPGKEPKLLRIKKVKTEGADRDADKKAITDTEYEQEVKKSVAHLEKDRYEFMMRRDGIDFSVKYDVFSGGELFMVEVDAKDDQQRAAFKPEEFLPFKLIEVTGNDLYYGWQVTKVLNF